MVFGVISDINQTHHVILYFVVLLSSVVCYIEVFVGFEIGSHCVALTGLELTIETRLAWNSEIYLLCLPSAWIKGVCPHA